MTQPKDADNLDFELIETDEKLKNLTGQLKPASVVALDTEADSFHHYRPQVWTGTRLLLTHLRNSRCPLF
ncbi:MAG: hypothetical protein ACYSOI_07385 [Planctomycetota bacterium]|jgi:hypothetical protein